MLSKEKKQEKKKKREKKIVWTVGVSTWYLGHQTQWIISRKGLFSSTNRGWSVDTKCRCFPRLTSDPTGSAQRGCPSSKPLPRLAELVPVAAEGLLRLVMSPHPFCLGLLQLLISAWLSIFSLFFHKNAETKTSIYGSRRSCSHELGQFVIQLFKAIACLQFLAMLTSKMHFLVKIVTRTAKMDKVYKSCRITLGQKAKNKS